MTWQDFLEKAQKGVAYSDGSMGVFLQQYGLGGEDCPELWNVTKPDIIQSVHRAYIEAGSDLVITNTLGGNSIKLESYHLADRLEELNAAGVRNAREASRGRAIVAADIGPTGHFVKPLGDLSFDEMVNIYKEQIVALANAGADALFFETHIDILELKAGILAAREVCDLPIIASVTFESDGRMVTGTSPEAAFTTLEALGVDIMGMNCGTGPKEMLAIMERVGHLFETPIIVQANAGLPHLVNGKTHYSETPESYVDTAIHMLEYGACVIGGCCGTTPEYIKLLIERSQKEKPYLHYKKRVVDFLKLSSRFEYHRIGHHLPFTIIGERINPTARKLLVEDILSGSFQRVREEALKQQQAGAHVLDVNMGIPQADEAKLMENAIDLLSTVVHIPLAIDTSSPLAAIRGMRHYPGKPLLNSITAEPERLALLPEIKKYGAAFVALPIDEHGIPESAEKRVAVMKRILSEAEKLGIDKKNILADPLVMTVSSDQKAPRQTLATLRAFREELGLFTTMGLSNISFGLPARSFINQAFLTMAIENGLNTAIVNPLDEQQMGLVRATDVLLERDPSAMEYIRLYSGQKTITPPSGTVAQTIEQRISEAVIKGHKDDIEKLLDEALEKGLKPKAILDELLIPAITEVGQLYEKRQYFLPQLLLSAETMQKAFAKLEPLLRSTGTTSQGTLVFATVQGDVHDIGKNIVILMLRNQGFEVIDLGKDVPAETIYRIARERKADIVGLSALMTTTMPRMAEFMELLKKENASFPVMVGGAAVNRQFAESIGAYYAVDAVDAIRVAQKILEKT
ncbi:homocysteine S-methyltransferase family protein [Thermospira aquatica]|uniref:Methionine synthase n=1 Tax=Thermospira aquatica TaxID=2828656 RepID=A0AAX3BFE9_9SPIR|nr:homocysteine S-methyltransferase family protein [Thermospira aquatica]URA10833.1 homocysteine S-methyltransferase family protein [Thermospira aquatica]